MTYAVKECFYTLQGEGAQAGRPAVFLRFAGCNLWSGREQDRAGAVCRFCDTDFVGTDGEGGGKFTTAEALAAGWRRAGRKAGGNPMWSAPAANRCCSSTAAIAALHAAGFEVAVETNGTQPAARAGLDLRQPQGRRAAGS
jgi:7-carboxy-7-deazaguanine synthase